MEQPSPRPLLEVENLTTVYPTPAGPVRAVDGVSFSISAGQVLALVGESGSGKSQTARSIMGLIQPPGRILPASSVRYRGKELVGQPEHRMRHVRGPEMAMIYQHPRATLTPVYTVGDQVAEMIVSHEGASWAAARARAIELFAALRIPDPERRARQYPHELSGGLCQRVAIAAAISCKPRLLIADEATTALDVTTQAEILDLLRGLVADLGVGMLFISHDLAVVRSIASDIAVMYAGRIVETLPADAIKARARHPYTLALLRSATLTPDEDGRLPTIPGSVPEPANRPPGCPFAPRCAYRFEPCGEDPPLVPVGEGHRAACWLTTDRAAADAVRPAGIASHG